MSEKNLNKIVIYAGRYNETEILSGPEKAAKRIFNYQSNKEKTVFIQYFFDGTKYGTLKKLFGKEIVTTDSGSEIATIGLLRLISYCRKYKPSVIHIITFERFAVLLYILKIFRNIKFIYTVHGIVTFGNNNLKKLSFFYKLKDRICEKIFLKYSDIITIPSLNYIEMVKQAYKINDDKIRVIPNGCDEEFSELNGNRDNSNKLNLFLLTDKIGFNDSIETISNVLSKISSYTEIYEIGNGLKNNPDRDIKKNIHSMDRMKTPELAEFMRKMDIFLSLYKYDTFSITALEAMAAGVIPIITNETGLSSYIEDGTNGFLVNSGDKDRIIEIISGLNSNNELRAVISNNAKKIYEVLKWERVYNMYLQIYDTLA